MNEQASVAVTEFFWSDSDAVKSWDTIFREVGVPEPTYRILRDELMRFYASAYAAGRVAGLREAATMLIAQAAQEEPRNTPAACGS